MLLKPSPLCFSVLTIIFTSLSLMYLYQALTEVRAKPLPPSDKALQSECVLLCAHLSLSLYLCVVGIVYCLFSRRCNLQILISVAHVMDWLDGENIDEYYAAFSTRGRVPRTPIDGQSAN